MRNAWRVFAFDIAAPLAAVAALLMIGYALDWAVWWVAVCSVLCTLVVQGMGVNFVLFRRDKVTVGTDDEGPGLRLAVVGLTTAALVAAVLVTYTRWTTPDRDLNNSMTEVVRLSAKFSESVMTFTPQDPMGSVNRAAELMEPDRASRFRDASQRTAAEEAAKNVTTQAQTVSAGVEAISVDSASVAVVMRATRSVPNQPQDKAVIALRVALSNIGGQWRVLDFSPINPGPGQPGQ
jgi:hypothetical protein